MANCVTLSSGLDVACIDGIGGLKNAYFAPWDEANILPVVGGEVSGLTASGLTKVYKYTLRNDTNTYEEVSTQDKNTRNSLKTGTLTLALAKITLLASNELKMLALGEILVFVEDNEGNIFVVGNENGAWVATNTMTSGAAKSDFAGYNVIINSEERASSPLLSTAAKAQLKAIAISKV